MTDDYDFIDAQDQLEDDYDRQEDYSRVWDMFEDY